MLNANYCTDHSRLVSVASDLCGTAVSPRPHPGHLKNTGALDQDYPVDQR
jgi:hypothetical protein